MTTSSSCLEITLALEPPVTADASCVKRCAVEVISSLRWEGVNRSEITYKRQQAPTGSVQFSSRCHVISLLPRH
jgi:hypothetical protein